MSVSDGKLQMTIPIHIRGSHRNLGQPVARAFPKVMTSSDAGPILSRRQSGRLELAQWLASSNHPLTARVIVNRIWRWHFGQGLVGSTENFGVLGDRPTHPELLDWLARAFIESGWSVKDLHRLIMRSSVYRMASSHPDAERAVNVDPENHWLWRFRMQRLDAEQVRDSILYVSNRLDMTLGGKSVPLRNRQFVFDHTSIDHTRYDSLRRAIYLPVIRNNLYPFFEQFDFPDPTMPTGSRNTTTVAPQSLLLMNADLVFDSARSLAEQLCRQHAEPDARAQQLVKQLFGRSATPAEIAQLTKFAVQLASNSTAASTGGSGSEKATEPELQGWALVCQSLMISNEFFMIR